MGDDVHRPAVLLPGADIDAQVTAARQRVDESEPGGHFRRRGPGDEGQWSGSHTFDGCFVVGDQRCGLRPVPLTDRQRGVGCRVTATP